MSNEGTREGFLAQIVDEFGIQWTSIAVFSTLIFSAFNLDAYINTAAWMVGTVVAFSAVFVFRRQVSPRFPRISIVALPVMVALLALGYYIATLRTSMPTYLAHHRIPSSLFLSGAVMLPTAVLLLSYRKQESSLGVPLPKELQQAVREGVLEAVVYRRDVDYRVSMISIARQKIVISVELEYTVVNRTPARQSTVIALTPIRRSTEFLGARVEGRNYDVEDPQYRTEYGLQIPIRLEPHEQKNARIGAKITYNVYDSDTFCTWLPATNLELHIINPFPRDVWIAVESLLNEKVTPDLAADGTATYRTSRGLLPHQGFRVSWGKVLKARSTV